MSELIYKLGKYVDPNNLVESINEKDIERKKFFLVKHCLLENIKLDYGNFKWHIKLRHSEMSLDLIFDILNNPDNIFKKSKSSKEYYFEKNINKELFRVIVVKKEVITAYIISEGIDNPYKNVYCYYNKEDQIKYNRNIEEVEEDMDYYKEIFGVFN